MCGFDGTTMRWGHRCLDQKSQQPIRSSSPGMTAGILVEFGEGLLSQRIVFTNLMCLHRLVLTCSQDSAPMSLSSSSFGPNWTEFQTRLARIRWGSYCATCQCSRFTTILRCIETKLGWGEGISLKRSTWQATAESFDIIVLHWTDLGNLGFID